MGFVRTAVSIAIEAAVALLSDADRVPHEGEECPDEDVFYDPNGAAHAHLPDTRGVPMDRDWFHGRH